MSTWLALTLLGAVLITALALSFVIEHFARRHELSQAGAQLTQVGWQLRDQLDRGMAERHAEIMALADSELLRSLADPRLVRDALQTLQRKAPLCTWIGVAAHDGHVLAATGGLLEGQNVSSRPWFQAGARGPFAGDVHNAVLLERLLPPQAEPWRFVDLAAPVVVDGTTRAVVGAHLSWEWAHDIERQLLAPVMRDQGIQTFIVQHDGQVLLGPEGSVGKQLDVGALAAASSLAGAVTAWPGEGQYVTAVVNTQGHGSYPGLGWRVVVRQPPAVALDRYAGLHQQLVLATVGVILLMAVLSPLAGRRLAAPLAQITHWLRNPQAPTSLSLRGRSYKEAHWLLAALVTARERLRAHAQELEQLNAGLEQRVSERTQELRRSREDLQTVADNLPALVALVDRELRYRFVNEAYRSWWGVEPETLLGSSMRDLVGEPNFGLLQPHVQKVLLGQRVTFEQEMALAGKARFVEVTYVPNRDGQEGLDGFMVLVYDVTERKKLELQFAHAAHHDALTGMPNRRRLMEVLTLSMLRAQRLNCPLVLLFLDLDGFKAVNDNHGHEAGDALLQAVAQRLRQSVRRTDTVARLAGDEFVVLLECMPRASDVEQVVEKIYAAISAPVVLPSGVQISVRASIGSAGYSGGRDVSAHQLLAQADAAMYEAKRASRGLVNSTAVEGIDAGDTGAA